MAETTMVQEIVYTFENHYDKNSLTLRLPTVFAQMTNKDANIELVTSNTLQPMKMIFSHNIITHSKAFIFINTECKGNEYKNAEQKGADVIKLFTEVLGFKEVSFFTNLSKK